MWISIFGGLHISLAILKIAAENLTGSSGWTGALFTSEGGSQADVNNRIRIGWMKWKEVSGVMCDRKMPVELKDKVFKTIIRPAMPYGSECWAVKKKDESKLN